MADLLTVEEAAEAFGVDTELVRNWCERGLIDCARPADDTYFIARQVVEDLTDGIEPARNRQDRVELFARVDSEQADTGKQVRTLDRAVYAKFTRRFSRDPPEESNDDDVAYYLDRYGMITHRIGDLLEPSPTPVDRTVEQLSKDVATLLEPLKGTSPTVGDVELRAVLGGIDAILEGRSANATYEIRTTIRSSGTGDNPRLETVLLASDVRDGEAVPVPVDRNDGGEFPIYDRYLSEWRSDLRSSVAELDAGTTFICAFLPSNCEAYRLEFRSGAISPSS